MRHVPKKLTDCPENLRESIDWLIQVRYGNGENGLGELAKALKKLIEEAISNATNSLQSEKKKLECPFKYSDKETYCQYYEKQIKNATKPDESNHLTEHEKQRQYPNYTMLTELLKKCQAKHEKYPKSQALKSVEDQIVQLGELAGQLGGFVGGGESVKNAVVKAIKACFDTNPHLKNDLKDVYNSHVTNLSESDKSGGKAGDTKKITELKDKISGEITETERLIEQQNKLNKDPSSSPSPSAESAKLQSKLDALEKVKELCEFLTNLKTSKDEPKNLLENLCSGLETFLGFNPSSKGYDGQGIVYSDLDRLCDAVMGFLSGVLDAVKDDEAVKTYDVHRDNNFTKAIETIKNSMHNPGGLSNAVEAVSRALGEWDREVTEKTNALKNELNTLKTKDFNNFDRSLNQLKSCNSSDVASKLEACINNASYMFHALSLIEKCFDDLDPELRNKLKDYVSRVKFEFGTLFAAAKNEPLKELVLTAENELAKLNGLVSVEINNRIKHMGGIINYEFQEQIKNPITRVKENLSRVDKDLTAWIEQAGNVIKEVVKKAEEVCEGLKNDVNPTSIGKNVKNVDAARAAIENTNKELKGIYNELETWNKEASSIVAVASTKCDAIFDKVAVGGSKNVIETKAKYIKDKATKLMIAYEAAKSKVGNLKNGVEQAVTALESQMKIDLGTIKKNIKQELLNVVNALKNGIQQAGESHHGVTHIIQGFREGVNNSGLGKESMLYKWADAGYSGSGIKAALSPLNRTDYLTEFQGFLKTLVNLQETVSGVQTTLFDAITTDLDTKVDGKLPQDGGSVDQVNIRVLQTYNTEKNKNPDAGGHYKKALDAVEKALEDFTKDPDNIPSGDAQKVIEDVEGQVRSITNDLRTIGDLVNRNSGGRNSFFEKPDTESVGVKPLLTEIQEGLKEKGLGDATQGLTTIKLRFNVQNSKVPSLCRTIEEGAQKIAAELQALQNLLKGAKYDDVIETLNELLGNGIEVSGDENWGKGNSVVSLRNIKNRISGILGSDDRSDSNTLATMVIKAGKFYDEVIKIQAENAIKEIKNYITGEFNNTIATIQRKASGEYCNKIEPLFISMQNQVGKQIVTMNATMNHDLASGVKGLLRHMMDKYNSNKLSGLKDQKFVKDLASPLISFLKPILSHVETEVKTADSTSSTKQENEHSNKVYDIHGCLSALLRHFDKNTSKYNFDDTFVTLLLALKSSLADLSAPRFSGYEQPLLLDSLKDGLTKLCEELDKSYVNTYSGQTIKWEEESNPDKTYCAKILVTITKIFGDDLAHLKYGCENGWKEDRISLLSQSGRYNHLGNFLRNSGYVVTKKDGSQSGELQCSTKMVGKSIVDRFAITTASSYASRLLMDTLESISESVKDYYETCHLGAWQSKTYPSSVYDMLRWLSGFTHNGVYETLSFNGFEELFEKPKEDDTITIEASGITGTNLDALSLSAYPHDIKPSNLTAALTDVCNHSHAVLTTILGHGHSHGVYACEFDTNSAGLVYPADFNALVCMICDVVNRLYRQLHFLYNQCQYNTELSGWLDCEYGQGVGGSGWRCNVDQCANQACNQKGGQRANQNGNQRADQRCDQHPKCGVKSPLQSFLEDGLQGFLPHQLKYEKGKVSCSVKDHSGIECITPLGFSGISHMASHRATGQRIVDVLAGYCGNHTSPLTRICGLFNCILPSAPKTLSDMFGFYYSFLYEWNDKGNRSAKRIENRETAFNSKVSEADFKNPGTKLDIISMFGSTDHKTETLETSHLTGDMYSLVCCNPSTNSGQPCGAYLRPLCYDICTTFSKEHADKYLSWIVYLTETFYTALQKLLEDCQKTCGADSKKCKIGKCKKDCKTKEHPLAPSAKHNDSCRSIVECGYIRPTFYKYGFIHNNVSSLSGVSGDAHKRTCTDFCTALGIVAKEGNVLYDIVNKTIPDFLWTIRQKFFWTTVALWSLSLFYLICVMVGRLDVLHIKSHLRIPSSHKITAQSLLAAAQVGRLAKISYLQA